MTAKHKKYIWLSAAACLLIVLIVWIVWGNFAVELNTYSVTSNRLPQAFDGFRIAQVSDLHNVQMGQGNEDLLDMLRDAKPDIIAITGDLIDSRNTDIAIALQFIREAVKIAPCYYVTGNHEQRIEAYAELKTSMEAAGVIVLDDEKLELRRDNETITIIGVNDPVFTPNYVPEDGEVLMQTKLTGLCSEYDGFTILLSHRPELFEVYVGADIDLVLSGHAHGGQIRLPLIGGIYAPKQGFFPKYDAGLFSENHTHMIVSRGIGNSAFPFRINNRPEVVLIELHSA